MRLFVGNIPKSKGKDEIEEELRKVTGKMFQKQRLEIFSIFFIKKVIRAQRC